MNRLMIIDDERWVRAALRVTIEKTGLPVEVVKECEDGAQALGWLADNTADLVLTDIRMPVLDGLGLVRELRERGGGPDIIMVSVHEEFHYVQEALRQGVIDYLVKPVEVGELTACLGKWLEKRKHTAFTAAAVAKHSSPVIAQVMQYLERTPLKEVTLSDAARHVHVNSCYLSQLFKQQLKVNFVDYLAELRLKEAKQLLATTELRLTEIAVTLGYADLPYFSNVFKKALGCTPSEYRARCLRG